jgi:hypothetical protein
LDIGRPAKETLTMLTRLRPFTLALAMLPLGMCVGSLEAGEVKLAVGQSIWMAAEPGGWEAPVIESDLAQKHAETALQEALDKFGPGKPKAIIFFENLRRLGAVRKALQAKAGDIPVYGIETGGYGVIGPAGMPARKAGRSMTVLAIGGDVELQTAVVEGVEMPIKDWEWKDQKNPDGSKWDEKKIKHARDKEIARHGAWGRALAEKFTPVEGKTNLYLQLGCQHTPRMVWITEGAKTVFDEEKDKVRYWGGAAADHGHVTYRQADNVKGDRLLGIMISGDFDVVQIGAPDIEKDQQVDVWRQKMEAALAKMDGRPDGALLVGCAGWHNQLEEKHKVQSRLLSGIPLFGCFAGGEIGRYSDNDEPIGKAGQMFLTLIKGTE